VNKNNDGFHINSSQYVHIANCDITCQDDACALFGSNKFVTVTNCSFSTRWSVFRFGGGEAENITISNCVIYDTYGCPIKMRCGARARFENITFSNLIMKNVTGPISIGLDSSRRGNAQPETQPVRGIVRNIAFNGIRATVVAKGRQHEDLPFPSDFRPGETRSCIVINGVGSELIEKISFHDVHVVYEGGGTSEEAARDVPKLAGEYFEIGTPPAYGVYARNVRGLTLHNVRLEVATPDLRPAMTFDNVADASVNGLSAQGTDRAESLLRFIETRDVLLTGCRVVTPAPVFLKVEGATSEAITIDGGDISKAAKPVAYSRGATARAVKTRSSGG
jgi:polygalacturonase